MDFFPIKTMQESKIREDGTPKKWARNEDMAMERGQEKRKTKRSSTVIQQYLSNSCSEPGSALHAKAKVEPPLT